MLTHTYTPPHTTPAHGPALYLGHVNVAQRKHAQRLEQLPRALLQAEHDARLERLGRGIALRAQQRVPVCVCVCRG
jgi:hypothetical protein